MCSMPSRWRARPSWVRRKRSGAVPDVGVWTAQWAIGVEGRRQPVALEHRAQDGHDRRGALAAVHQLGIEQLLGGVVDDCNQRVLDPRDQGEPGMQTAIEMHQLAETRPRLPSAPMAASRATLGDEARRLQGLLDETVGQSQTVLALRDLMKVPDI